MAAAELYRSADLLVRARTGCESRYCVVTFHSYTDHRTLEREGFGEGFLASRGVNAVHILSRDNEWYLLPDIELALEAAAKAVASFERVSVYGSSMGAYAAMRFGGLAGATTAIALSPQFSLDPRVAPFENRWELDARRLDYEIERRLARKGFVPSAYVFYDPTDRDARHVELFRPSVAIHDVRLPDCGHPVTGFLAEVRLLERAVLEAAEGKFDPAAFEREALAMRERAPQYYLTLASRPNPRKRKVELVRRAHELFATDVGYMARYAQALWRAGRDEEAVEKFDQAMKAEPDHHFVMRFVCEFLDAKGRRPAARAAVEWLSRLHPGAAPIEHVRASLSQPRLSETPRHWRARLARLRSGQAAPRPTLSPPLARLKTPPGASPPRAPASPPTIRAWMRHASVIEAVPGSPIDIALIGDSLAEEWPKRAWRGRRVLNLGSSGDRSQHLLWRLACFDDGGVDAKAAIIIIGVNNLKAGDPVEAIIEAVGDVVRETRRLAPRARIAIVSLPPFGPNFQFRDDDRKTLNESLARLPEVVVVREPADWAPHSAEASCYRPDALHFTRAGYERLTVTAMRALAAAP